jgi:hypothetical protein
MKLDISFESISTILNHAVITDPPLLGGWLEAGAPVLFAGEPGAGKSLFVLWLSLAIAYGGEFLNWSAPHPKKVCILDGEMRLKTMQKRLISAQQYFGLDNGNLQILGRHVFRHARQPFPDLRCSEDRNKIIQLAKGADVLVLDNINALWPAGDENSPQFWREIEAFIFEAQDAGLTTVALHHTPKSNRKSPAGSSRNLRVFEIIGIISKVSSMGDGQSAHFNLEFIKNRDLCGGMSPISAKLTTDPETLLAKWSAGPLKESSVEDPNTIDEQIKELHQQGYSVQQIMDATGKGRTFVYDRLKNLRREIA